MKRRDFNRREKTGKSACEIRYGYQLASPFNNMRLKVLKEQQATQEDKEAPTWRPEVCLFKDAQGGGAVTMAMQRRVGPVAETPVSGIP